MFQHLQAYIGRGRPNPAAAITITTWTKKIRVVFDLNFTVVENTQPGPTIRRQLLRLNFMVSVPASITTQPTGFLVPPTGAAAANIPKVRQRGIDTSRCCC